MLKLNDIIKKGRFKNKSISDIITNNRKDIITLIKEGYEFDDEVLNAAKYKRYIKNKNYISEIVKHTQKETKSYQKDINDVDKILEEIFDDIKISKNLDKLVIENE